MTEKEVKLVMGSIECIQTETDVLKLGIEEPTSRFIKILFNEVFGDSMVGESANEVIEDDVCDILSLNQPYESIKDSDHNVFWQDLFV
ncbi:MAG: hypothetical protein AAFY76_24150 [Cyanobacteria bacterium J06649_11]